ncbi:MAG: PEP-CTERM sorting domain-containing protein [Phycisphaerales bacterium]|nr:PEP-CTERM sorting domain-containing protein [Phycisphaerales bacterium]
MNLSSHFVALALGVSGALFSAGAASGATVLIDFSDDQNYTGTDSWGRSWNNVNHYNSAGPVNGMGLKDTTGSSTGIDLFISNDASVTDKVGFSGRNIDGATSPDGQAAARGYPVSATRDSLFGSTAQFGGLTVESVRLTLKGLDSSQAYDLYFFASRMGVSDNRETEYEVAGATTTSAYLNAANNSGNITSLTNFFSDANGEITIKIDPGPNNTNGSGFYYLGVMELVAVPEPVSLSLLSLGGLALLSRRRASR